VEHRTGSPFHGVFRGTAIAPARRVVRRLFLNFLIVGFVAASGYDVVTDSEQWPFSQYPMFSVAWRSPTFTWLRLIGVTADGGEVALDANRYLLPFDQSRLPKALRLILAGPDGPAHVRQALADCLARYEELRRAGEHDGPPLVAMRLYELGWTIDATAANVDRPEVRRFIAEAGGR
jgi:hypothetical protein